MSLAMSSAMTARSPDGQAKLEDALRIAPGHAEARDVLHEILGTRPTEER